MGMPGAVAERRLDDGRLLTVYPELFGTGCLMIDDNAYVRGEAHCDRDLASGEFPWPRRGRGSDGGSDFYFQFASVALAVAALEAMVVTELEPAGWFRAAPPRWRRRLPDGREFVSEMAGKEGDGRGEYAEMFDTRPNLVPVALRGASSREFVEHELGLARERFLAEDDIPAGLATFEARVGEVLRGANMPVGYLDALEREAAERGEVE